MALITVKTTIRLLGATLAITAGATQAADRPVILELFTSQSCSSCPPAEALLHRLRSAQPIAGVHLIPLSEHVDYWDQLGWRDPYSSHQYTRRQQQYAAQVFRSGEVYTPQLVVDGRKQAVGSDTSSVVSAIRSAANAPNRPMTVSAHRSGANIVVDVSMPAAGATGAEIWLALTQNDIVTHVGGGENGGRTLHEDGVVRVLKQVGTLDGADAFHRQALIPLQDVNARMSTLRIVAFAQSTQDRRIVGAAEAGIQ